MLFDSSESGHIHCKVLGREPIIGIFLKIEMRLRISSKTSQSLHIQHAMSNKTQRIVFKTGICVKQLRVNMLVVSIDGISATWRGNKITMVAISATVHSQ